MSNLIDERLEQIRERIRIGSLRDVAADRDFLMAEVDRLRGRVEGVWDEGYRSGHSRAMRRMSDEPDVQPGVNPYRVAIAEVTQ